jgi:hypothetical protein
MGASIKPSALIHFAGGATNATPPTLDARFDVVGALRPEDHD